MLQGKIKIQTSESLLLGIFLAMVGGFMDAYSYVCRGGVFANAETGNIVMFSINLASLNYVKASHYLLPIIAFAAGVAFAEYIRKNKDSIKSIHWRQGAVILEALALVIIAFLPQEMNSLVNAVISYVCGIQVVAFSKVHGNSIATTMCTGNLRTGTQNLMYYRDTHEKRYLRISMKYYLVIFFFILGAMLGGKLTYIFKEKAILIASFFLFLVFILMFWESINE